MLALVISSCSSNEDPVMNNEQESGNETIVPTDYTPIELTGETRSTLQACNNFSVNFFREALLSDVELSGNPCYSPLSVFSTLSMLANGDGTQSRDEILNLLGLPEGTEGLSMLNTYQADLCARLSGLDNQVACTFANALVLVPEKKSYLSESFKKTLCDVFKAESIFVDPSTQTGLESINKWCEDNTGEMIKKFLESPMDGEMALLNASYFKGRWQTPFDKEATKEMPFACMNGKNVPAMFMNREEMSCCYEENELGSSVSMPFGNGNFEMVFILPSANTDLRGMISGIKENNVLLSPQNVRKVNLLLPRFEGECKSDVIETLCKVSPEFDLSHGFDNIIPPYVSYINTIRHATKIKVDENGAEAAAATAAGMLGANLSDRTPSVIDLTFDRPFMYVVRETSTDAIVFMGCVTEL